MDRGAWRATVPWGYKESNMTERLTLSLPQPFLNPLTLPQFSSVQSFSHVQLFATSWTAACQASLSSCQLYPNKKKTGKRVNLGQCQVHYEAWF